MVLPAFDNALLLLLATIAVAGIARGLSGFGSGMIVAPIAAALYDPVTAVVILVIIDTLPIVPVSLPALKVAHWREVLPVLAGLILFVPLGVYVLKHGDPDVLRWLICTAILAGALALWRGWRYRGPRSLPISLSVGGLAGVLSGIASIPGPPILVYWLASALPAAIVRANLLALFFLSEFNSIANLWAAGLFEQPRVILGIVAAPVYFGGLLTGWALYGLSSEAIYRRVTFLLIVGSALVATPMTSDALNSLVAGAAG